MTDDEQKFWQADSFANSGTPRWKTYAATVELSEPLLPTPNPSGYDRILSYIDDEMRKAAAEGRDFMSSSFLNQLFPSVPPPPQTRLQRLRSWLGWKLWRLAVWLEPNCAD